MPIKLSCDACGAKFEVGEEHAGRRGRCGRCGSAVQIPTIVQPVSAVGIEAGLPPVVPPPKEADILAPARSFHSKIAGVSKENQDGSNRQLIIRSCNVGESLVAKREPQNRFDKNAVALNRRFGQQLGYLNSELAAEVAPWLDQGQRVEMIISDITGGDESSFTEARLFGVNIHISLYGSVMPQDGENLTVAQEVEIALVSRDFPRLFRALERRSPSLFHRHQILSRVVQTLYSRRNEDPTMSDLCEQAAWLHIAELP
ncbi:MAG TPA: HIRAN domain-containing protein [Pirellulales bacterium]|nr:HIRAN domain-containing protein [Pirellulales bacterium]